MVTWYKKQIFNGYSQLGVHGSLNHPLLSLVYCAGILVSEYSKASHLYDLQFCKENSRSVLLYLINSLDYNQCAVPQTGGSASNFIHLLSLSFA